MTAQIYYMPTEAERIAIERATAHAAAESVLERDARWALDGVTDLSVARVMRALERGVRASRGKARWSMPGVSFASPNIMEMVRTGLVVHVRMHGHDVLVPAPVHLGQWNDQQARWTAACRPVGENMGPKRVRLHREPIVVDCLSCFDSL